MNKICFYVSGHGFGHSTRIIALINAIPENVGVIVKTSAPKWLYDLNITRPFDFHYCEMDIGAVQPNCLELDREETLRQFANIHVDYQSLVETEIEFVRQNNVGAIVFDIPPAVPLIAKEVGIPSIGISNFSWDEIYQPYVEEFPDYEYLIEEIAKAYAETTLLLRLPFHLPMAAFPRQVDWPLLARVVREGKIELRKSLDLPQEAFVVLLSFGGFDLQALERIPFDANMDCLFVSFFDESITVAANYRNYERQKYKHEFVVKAADVVMSKPGYGIVSECIANSTAMIYTERYDFLEYPRLVEGIEKHLINEHIPSSDLLSGNWQEPLRNIREEVKSSRQVETINVDDGHLTAKRIMEFL